MKALKVSLLGCIFITISPSILVAQTTDLVEVKGEINIAVTNEQNAFKNGDCDKVLEIMDDNITFLANGKRIPSKEIIGNFCNAIKRPFRNPILDKLDIYPLSNITAYTVRTLEYQKSETSKIHEFVTKIWKKIDDQWKIVHLHSTVKEINNN
jgi:ketosteroid isomerase-like protein